MSDDIDTAIAELERTLPIVGLVNIIERKARGHRKIKELRRHLALLQALEIAEESAA